MVEKMRKRQLNWIGHALRRKDNEPAKIFALYEPEATHCRTKRGRKTTSYFSYICNLLFPAKSEITLQELVNLARTRELWKKRVAECCKATSD